MGSAVLAVASTLAVSAFLLLAAPSSASASTPAAAFLLSPSVPSSDRGGGRRHRAPSPLRSAASEAADSSTPAVDDEVAPQVWATGYSPKLDLLEAIQDATESALRSLPHPPSAESSIDLAVVTVSSLYDGQSSPSVVVPAVLGSASAYGGGVRNLVGCTAGGIVSCVPNEARSEGGGGEVTTVESEGAPGVSVTLGILPDVDVKTFHVMEDDVPDDASGLSPQTWKGYVGLRGWAEDDDNDGGASRAGGGEDVDEDEPAATAAAGPPVFMLLPSPAFQTTLDDFLVGLSYAFPSCSTFGAISSTVSSLSRARLFRHDSSDPQCSQTHVDGCVGVALRGDIVVETMVAQGAKPVGGIYRIVSGRDSTIGAIMLDEAATREDEEASEAQDEDDEEEGGDDDSGDAKSRAAAAYAKAAIPKPVLAEANYVMKTLSDDDRAFMRRAILVGLERGGAMGRTPGELARLARGEGHRFAVHQVASAGMKDGSVTLPLGSVDVAEGTRFRFFVREGNFARREVEAVWTGYKKRSLERSFAGSRGGVDPAGCMVFTTMDRGTKLFGSKPGFESGMASTFLPTVPSVSGFFSNGVIGKLDDTETAGVDVTVHGSASCCAVFGSKTGRPVYSPAKAAAAEAAAALKKAEEDAEAKSVDEEDEKRIARTKSLLDLGKDGSTAPRSDDGELILKRREVHSGRAISVSTVEWSVAEKAASPTSAMEGYMWDKETEVDRFRERVPLSNLVSQCNLGAADPTKPRPRDWVGPIKRAGEDGSFVIIPECKRMEPTTGSLRRRYDLSKLVRQLTAAGAAAISVNCDPVLFGGSLEDITTAREASASAALDLASDSEDDGVVVPPILASDLLLYPYQLYKLRLAGADAVTLVVGALESKDLLYLTKIAASLQMQVVASVTSEVQIRAVSTLSEGSIAALSLSNRELEDFSFDETGERALSLLRSEALGEFREKHGEDVPVLVEGQVGIIERPDGDGRMSSSQYLTELREAGAFGAVVGSGLAMKNAENGAEAYETIRSECG